MRLQDIAGQSAAKQGFLAMCHSGRLPHALMLEGKAGAGGLPMAIAMAQYVLCQGNKGDDACGSCPACAKVSRLEHADLHFTFPSFKEKSTSSGMSKDHLPDFREFVRQTPYASTYDWLQFIKAENKQGNITAAETRNIIEQLSLKSYEGGWKVQIIWRPEYLGKEGNILLKLIEEPPPYTLILLVAESADEVLGTIRSRAQTIRLVPMPMDQLAQALVNRGAVSSADKAAQIAALAGGSYGQALSLAQDMGETDLLHELRRWFIAMFQKDKIGLARFAEDWAKTGREQQKSFLDFAQEMLGYGLRESVGPGLARHLPGPYAAFVARLAEKRYRPDAYGSMAGLLSEVRYRIERNCNPKAQMMALSIRMGRAMDGIA